MPLSLKLARRRYQQQARWTAQLRRHLFSRYGLPHARRVLDIGCGPGAVLRMVDSTALLFGLDIDLDALRIAREDAAGSRLTAGDAHQLPYASASFDIALFHFVLLWLGGPERALREAARVTRRGGAVIAFAEPDYSQRIDQPGSFAVLGKLQTDALRVQGANPELGSQLAELMKAAGLTVVEEGRLKRGKSPQAESDDLEQEVLRADLEGRVPEAQLNGLLTEVEHARRAGTLSFHVPTFYAVGKVL